MKKLLIFLIVAVAACTNQSNTEQQANKTAIEEESTAAAPLNNGSKWKADEATKKNVAEMAQVVNDTIYADATKRMQLYATLQTKIDTLVKQCSMQGAEHDALHVWLKNVLKDMKELKDENDEYNEVYADLKRDIGKFNDWFE